VDREKKRRFLLDTSIKESYLFRSSVSNIIVGEKEFPFAYYHSDGDMFHAAVDRRCIPGPIFWNDDVHIDFKLIFNDYDGISKRKQTNFKYVLLDNNVIPKRKRMPIVSRDNYLVLKNYATESWMSDSAYEHERKTTRKYLDIDGVLGVETWPKFQLNSPIVSMLNKKQGIKWTLLGTILTVNK
jgi:hypothetical protein